MPISTQNLKNNGYHLTASSIVIDKNSVLLVYHPKLKAWAQPGGHVEGFELPQYTCIRETQEETGIVVTHVNSHFDDSNITFLIPPLCTQIVESVEKGDLVYHLDFVYLCKPTQPQDLTLNNVDTKWVEFNTLPGLNLAKNVFDLVNLAKDRFV